MNGVVEAEKKEAAESKTDDKKEIEEEEREKMLNEENKKQSEGSQDKAKEAGEDKEATEIEADDAKVSTGEVSPESSSSQCSLDLVRTRPAESEMEPNGTSRTGCRWRGGARRWRRPPPRRTTRPASPSAASGCPASSRGAPRTRARFVTHLCEARPDVSPDVLKQRRVFN